SLLPRRPTKSTLFPYTTLFRSQYYNLGGNSKQCMGKSCKLELRSGTWQYFKCDHKFRSSGIKFKCYSCRFRFKTGCNIYSYFRRSEEHTSELQSRENLVCRLLL